MNRALPTLILLLGTLGGSIVALGVARDLQRAGVEPTAGHSPVVPTTVSAYAATPTVGGVILRNLAAGPAEYAVPVACYPSVYELTWSATDAVEKLLQYRALLQLSLGRQAVHILDNRDFTEAEQAKSRNTDDVDHLIAANDGVVDEADADDVPYGYVAVGAERTLVQIQQRGGSEIVSLWTGELHFGGTPHALLDSTLTTLVPTPHRAAKLPCDKVLAWSSERVAMQRRVERFARRAASLAPAAIAQVGPALEWLAWADRQIDQGFAMMTVQVKRELWLLTAPAWPAGVRSAELPHAEKR